MIKKYYRPTPVKWRKFGDALLAVSTFVSGYGMIENYTWLAIASLAIGVIGKFLSNFFSEDKDNSFS